MKKENHHFSTERRNFMKTLAMGSAAGLLGFAGNKAGAAPYEPAAYAKGMAPVKIKSVKAIATAPSAQTLLL